LGASIHSIAEWLVVLMVGGFETVFGRDSFADDDDNSDLQLKQFLQDYL